MPVLILGLIVFLGGHSIRIVAEGWREGVIARIGERRWKGVYSLVSLVGLVLIVWGYGAARSDPVALWAPPVWTRHVAALLTLPLFVLFAAAYIRDTHIRAWLGHPMLVGVKLWALAHLLANGTLADVLLFGGFLVWAVSDYKSARARDRAAGVRYRADGWAPDVKAIVVGLVVWFAFAFYLHGWLIGVRPFG